MLVIMALTKIIIGQNKLRHLYLTQKMSAGQIAKIFGCNHVTILNKLKKFNIKKRTRLGIRKPVIISYKTLSDLYLNDRLSQSQIANKLNCSRRAIETRMKFYRITPRNYRESNTKYPKKDFNNNLIEKAYLIGFRLGDLNISRRHYLIRVACSSTVEAQVNLIKSLFSPYSFVYTKPSRILNGKQVIDIQCLLNESFNFLLPKQDTIENWILNDTKFFFSFLAGYIDAEGHIYTRLQDKIPFSGLEIGTYDKNILQQIWERLNQEGINCPKPIINRPAGHTQKNGLRNNKDCWRLSISKKMSLAILFNKLGPYIKHGKRIMDMNTAHKNVLARIINILERN